MFAIHLSKAIFREITDALVIFSMSFLTYMLIAEWGGLSLLRNVLRLDHLKQLHEVYGHLGRDEALSQIGSRIRDSASSSDVFARSGDGGFALCLAGMDPENALKVASALREVVKKPVQIGIEHHGI